MLKILKLHNQCFLKGFPRVIGAIDGTHIAISAALGEHEADFVNRKSIHSLNVQVQSKMPSHFSSTD